MSTFVAQEGESSLSLQPLPRPLLETQRLQHVPLENRPTLGFLVETTLGAKPFVVLSGKPLENPERDTTFVFLSGTPGQFFDTLEIGQKLEDQHTVIYIDALRGWGVTDDNSPLKNKVSVNDEMRVIYETLVRLRSVLGKHVVLVPYSSAAISALPLVAQNRESLPEIQAVVALNPVLAPFMDEPMEYNLDGKLLVNPITGGVTAKVAVTSPGRIAKEKLDMIQGQPSEGFMQQYILPWGANQETFQVSTLMLNDTVTTTAVKAGYTAEELLAIAHTEYDTMMTLGNYQLSVIGDLPKLKDVKMTIVTAGNDLTVKTADDSLQPKPNAKGYGVYNPATGVNGVYEQPFERLQQFNPDARLYVFPNSGHGFWNKAGYTFDYTMDDRRTPPDRRTPRLIPILEEAAAGLLK